MEKPMTDQQIYNLAYSDWLELLKSLWIAIGKPIENDRLKVYANRLGDIPYGLLEKAITRVQNTATYNIVPTIAAIRAAVQIELADANCQSCEDWKYQKWYDHASREEAIT